MFADIMHIVNDLSTAAPGIGVIFGWLFCTVGAIFAGFLTVLLVHEYRTTFKSQEE